jgi:hypothetical protein
MSRVDVRDPSCDPTQKIAPLLLSGAQSFAWRANARSAFYVRLARAGTGKFGIILAEVGSFRDQLLVNGCLAALPRRDRPSMPSSKRLFLLRYR